MNLSDFTNVSISALKIDEVPRFGLIEQSPGKISIDLSNLRQTPDIFYHKFTENTEVEIKFSNLNKIFLFVMENAGNFSVNFPAELKWAGGETPTFSEDGIDYVHIVKVTLPEKGSFYSASIMKNIA